VEEALAAAGEATASFGGGAAAGTHIHVSLCIYYINSGGVRILVCSVYRLLVYIIERACGAALAECPHVGGRGGCASVAAGTYM